MPPTSTSTSLSITNPLVLYRSLVAIKKIRPDPAQHRLAIQLQDLYLRLKDYEPELDYRHRLAQVKKIQSSAQDVAKQRQEADSTPFSKSGLLSSFFRESGRPAILALTKTIPIHDSAMQINSPLGMLLYGEVGRGKSMLLDLLYTSLPSRKKRRWHFNTFMLDIFRRIELGRIQRSSALGLEHEHVVLSLAKQTIETSPILFLDEFQMPDRTSSKLLNSFMTAFFHLGGVLVASSNRMPEELAKASGVEFRAMKGGNAGWMHRLSPGQKAAKADFGQFLEVLKARCEAWEMEGERDWRREGEDSIAAREETEAELDGVSTTGSNEVSAESTETSSDAPTFYHVNLSTSTASPAPLSFLTTLKQLNPGEQWSPTTLTIYSRRVIIPQTFNGVTILSFPSLCSANLGPADYVTIASNFHTLIVQDVPVLTLLQKNEARRFITFLDACYEAKCRLMIEAAAPPDSLFFPETRRRAAGGVGTSLAGVTSTSSILDERDSDSITSEAFSEMYQEATSPFRPNVSMYADNSSPPTAFPTSARRSILADEDADFGPTYGNGRSHGASQTESRDDLDRAPSGFAELDLRQGPDFTINSAFTGQDEQFAYKRARSRLWEMCGRRWWYARPASNLEEIATWWTPVNQEGRFWETAPKRAVQGDENVETTEGNKGVKDDALFRHGASPFRTRIDPPPKFGFQHAWGMMRWGKKAGEWGKGVEGDRKGPT